MAFEHNYERYASFGVVTSLSGHIIDTCWYIIDHYLVSVFPLRQIVQFELINQKGKLALRFSQQGLAVKMIVDTHIDFDPFFPRRVLVLDKEKRQTVLLPDELELF